MSCMLSTNVCVPAGALVQVIAGDVPSPGAAPSAAWLNFTGNCPPSEKPSTVIVIGGAGAAPRPAPPPAPRPPRSCAATGRTTQNVTIRTKHNRKKRMLFLPKLNGFDGTLFRSEGALKCYQPYFFR